MNIIGNIYLVDEPHIEMLKRELSMNPAPGGGLATGTMLCIDLDETDNTLEQMFPFHCQKGTLLCPPPKAMYREIDGDQEGFIQEYYAYLDYDESVQDFIASMLLFLHIGGNIRMYTPSYIEDDTIWMNTLLLFFFTRYGITIGTSAERPAGYDSRYDGQIANMMYRHGVMEIFDYVNSCTEMIAPYEFQDKICQDLLPYCGPEENPLDVFAHIRYSLTQEGKPITKPALIFDR